MFKVLEGSLRFRFYLSNYWLNSIAEDVANQLNFRQLRSCCYAAEVFSGWQEKPFFKSFECSETKDRVLLMTACFLGSQRSQPCILLSLTPLKQEAKLCLLFSLFYYDRDLLFWVMAKSSSFKKYEFCFIAARVLIGSLDYLNFPTFRSGSMKESAN